MNISVFMDPSWDCSPIKPISGILGKFSSNKNPTKNVSSTRTFLFHGGLLKKSRDPTCWTGRFLKRKSTTHDRCRSGIHASLEIKIGGPSKCFPIFFWRGVGKGVVPQAKSVFFWKSVYRYVQLYNINIVEYIGPGPAPHSNNSTTRYYIYCTTQRLLYHIYWHILG